VTREKKKATKELNKPVARYADELLKKLRANPVQAFKDISFDLNISKSVVAQAADELKRRGYSIAYYSEEGTRYIKLLLDETDDSGLNVTPVPIVKRKVKIAFISELRMGSLQSQISMAHWLYKEVFAREDVDFGVIVGGMTIGLPSAVLQSDIFKVDIKRPGELVTYAVNNFPKSKGFKSYIISNRREVELTKKIGINPLAKIAERRDDLAFAGDIQHTFDVKGVRIKVICPWDDNSPKGLSYGVQKITDGISDRPAPHIIVTGGMHERLELADYGSHGIYVYSVASLHTQMRRQARKGVHPRLGCLILELEFGEDKTFDIDKGLKAHHINLDNYAISEDCFKSVDDYAVPRISDRSRVIFDRFIREGVISQGELSRSLNVSKPLVHKFISGLQKRVGVVISFNRASKRFEFQKEEKTAFRPLNLAYEDVFRFLTKSGGLSCTHYGSHHDMPGVVDMAYKDAAASGVRRIYHAGDVTDGPGAGGYRGHQNDVKTLDMDAMEDYTVARWPRVKIKVSKEKPLTQSRLVINKDGQLTYEEYEVENGEVWLQTCIIDGNHDAWAKTMMGHRPVRSLALRLPELLRYLGPPDGSISMDGSIIEDGIYNRLTHGDGGLGYALSPKLQKHIASHRRRVGEIKTPTILWLGNWHTNCLLIQDVVGILLGSFKSEDEFHLRKGLVSSVGINILESYEDKNHRLTRVISQYRNYRKHSVVNK
jgi:Mn-dependent DtxR family transcriptional regulator